MPIKKQYDEFVIDHLIDICKASTSVVSWYDHGSQDGTVRGPHCRWFTCKEVTGSSKHYVSSIKDDVAFATRAMNNFLPLLELVKEQQAQIISLQIDGILLDNNGDKDG